MNNNKKNIDNVPKTDVEIPTDAFELPTCEPFELEPMEPIKLELMEPIKLEAMEPYVLEPMEPIVLDDFTTEKQPPKQLNATGKQVAEWMKQEAASGTLYQEHAAYGIEREFGDKYTYTNDNGNGAIAKEVLYEFRKMTPDLVWSRSGFYWRKRES